MAGETSTPQARTLVRSNLSSSNKRPLTPPQNLLQELQVQRYRLEYLIKCKSLKRPPQTLRLAGAKALNNNDRLILISAFETKTLQSAILQKKQHIQELQADIANLNIELQPLPSKVKKQYSTHYRRKVEFHRSQEETKWKD